MYKPIQSHNIFCQKLLWFSNKQSIQNEGRTALPVYEHHGLISLLWVKLLSQQLCSVHIYSGVYYYPRLLTSLKVSPNWADNSRIQKLKRLKLIDKANKESMQGWSRGVELKNGLNFVLSQLRQCVLAWFLSEVSSVLHM